MVRHNMNKGFQIHNWLPTTISDNTFSITYHHSLNHVPRKILHHLRTAPHIPLLLSNPEIEAIMEYMNFTPPVAA
jgi:hypothetical protein